MSVFEIDAYAKRQNKCDGHFSMHIVAKKKFRMIRQQQRRRITVDQKILKKLVKSIASISRFFSISKNQTFTIRNFREIGSFHLTSFLAHCAYVVMIFL